MLACITAQVLNLASRTSSSSSSMSWGVAPADSQSPSKNSCSWLPGSEGHCGASHSVSLLNVSVMSMVALTRCSPSRCTVSLILLTSASGAARVCSDEGLCGCGVGLLSRSAGQTCCSWGCQIPTCGGCSLAQDWSTRAGQAARHWGLPCKASVAEAEGARHAAIWHVDMRRMA